MTVPNGTSQRNRASERRSGTGHRNLIAEWAIENAASNKASERDIGTPHRISERDIGTPHRNGAPAQPVGNGSVATASLPRPAQPLEPSQERRTRQSGLEHISLTGTARLIKLPVKPRISARRPFPVNSDAP
jgi:hypothetical protein